MNTSERVEWKRVKHSGRHQLRLGNRLIPRRREVPERYQVRPQEGVRGNGRLCVALNFRRQILHHQASSLSASQAVKTFENSCFAFTKSSSTTAPAQTSTPRLTIWMTFASSIT